MKKVLILFIVLNYCSCTSSLDDAKYQPNNPCFDTQYLILKNKPDSSLNDVQKNYIRTKSAECSSFIARHEERMSDKQQADRNLIYVLVGLGALIVIGFFLALTLGAYRMH